MTKSGIVPSMDKMSITPGSKSSKAKTNSFIHVQAIEGTKKQNKTIMDSSTNLTQINETPFYNDVSVMSVKVIYFILATE